MSRPRDLPVTMALGLLLALYAYSRILEVAPHTIFGTVPQLAVVALHVLPAVAFALVHGARHYRLRGMLVFSAICLVIGNATENLSVVTGFPFGHYYFAGLMGLKLFHVPILLGLAYIGMAYVSWTLARLILGSTDAPVAGARFVLLPLLASFIMTAWDVAQDPIWATVLHGWVWRDGGRWFGVPISNFLGWLLTLFLMYLLFALYLSRVPASPITDLRAHWRAALLFYVLCAAGNLLQVIPAAVPAIVQDPTGKQWRVSNLTCASAAVSVFGMGLFAVLAWYKLPKEEKPATD